MKDSSLQLNIWSMFKIIHLNLRLHIRGLSTNIRVISRGYLGLSKLSRLSRLPRGYFILCSQRNFYDNIMLQAGPSDQGLPLQNIGALVMYRIASKGKSRWHSNIPVTFKLWKRPNWDTWPKRAMKKTLRYYILRESGSPCGALLIILVDSHTRKQDQPS